ncbi:hypothetical protein D3C71_2179260 [compost metagenome]
MALGPLERWIEDTDEDEILIFSSPQEMFVVLIEHVDVALTNRKDIALHILHLALAGDAVASLKMVAVLQQ